MDSTKDTAGPASYVDIMEKKHMEIPWHDYAKADSNVLIENPGVIEKSSHKIKHKKIPRVHL